MEDEIYTIFQKEVLGYDKFLTSFVKHYVTYFFFVIKTKLFRNLVWFLVTITLPQLPSKLFLFGHLKNTRATEVQCKNKHYFFKVFGQVAQDAPYGKQNPRPPL